MSAHVLLDGVELAVRSSVSWSLAYGVKPQVLSVEIPISQVERFQQRAGKQSSSVAQGTRARDQTAAAGPFTLRFVSPAAPERNVTQEGLFLIGIGPGDRLNTRIAQFADRRWLAPRTVVRRRYNLRRDSGNRRLVGDQLVERTPIQLAIAAVDPTYRRDTLDAGGVPWTARRVLEDVLQEVFGLDGFELPQADWLSDSVEPMDLWDRGDEALSRVSALLPGLEFFVLPNGKVSAANVYDGSEIPLMESLGDPNSGDWKVLDRRTIIPSGFSVTFQIDTELRFDFVETAQSGTRTREEPGRESLQLENVIKNPIRQLTLADGSVSTVGEYLPVQTYLDAINLLRAEDGLDRAEITQADIRRVWLGDWSGWATLYLVSASSGAIRAKWQALLSELRTHWRRTYRILPAWRDKIEGLRGVRAAILDNEEGIRAPATVHTQWIQRLNQLGLEKRFDARQHLINDDYAEDLSASGVSPFVASVLSSDLGIIQISGRTDEEGVAQSYTLGTVDAALLPTSDLRDASVLWGLVPLGDEFKLAIILTARRAQPNTIAALHLERVTLADACAKLRVPVPAASGPDYELRGFEDTARFAWRDADADAIREAYYTGAEFPPDLLVNTGAVRALALAHAARKLAEVLPRAVGTATWPMRQVVPTGGVRTVTHTFQVTDSGSASLTTLSAPGEFAGPSVWSLLPEGVRKVLRGSVES